MAYEGNMPGPGEPDSETMDEGSPDEGRAGEGEETAFLPVEIFPEMPKPGKVCSFKVISVDDGQVEVAYDHSAEESGGGGERPKAWERDFDENVPE